MHDNAIALTRMKASLSLAMRGVSRFSSGSSRTTGSLLPPATSTVCYSIYNISIANQNSTPLMHQQSEHEDQRHTFLLYGTKCPSDHMNKQCEASVSKGARFLQYGCVVLASRAVAIMMPVSAAIGIAVTYMLSATHCVCMFTCMPKVAPLPSLPARVILWKELWNTNPTIRKTGKQTSCMSR